MMHSQLKVVSLVLLFLSLVSLGHRPGQAAVPLGSCYQIFLPVSTSNVEISASANAASAQASGPLPCPPAPDGKIVDFNGDGYADLAIGNPGDSVVITPDAGTVTVLYGTSSGLASEDNQLWSQASVMLGAASGEHFGRAVTAADFDGDGYTDLAVGAPDETLDGISEAGGVVILYGGEEGLSNDDFQHFSQADASVSGAADAGDHFGAVLASADFNSDGFADLAVGVPDEGLEAEGIDRVGAVNILYGSASGLTTVGDLIIHLGLDTVTGTPGEDARFGAALAAADFDNDGDDDLAVGIPGYSLEGIEHAGAVMVLQGDPSGLSLLGESLWRQGANSVQGVPEPSDGFGHSLAAGDFDRNGAADLAIGVPFEDVAQGGGDVGSAGAFHVLYGSAIGGGLSGANDQLWHKGLDEVIGVPVMLEQFGHALVAADFDGDGADDLAVSVPGYSGDAAQQGLVTIFYSNGSILSPAGQGLLLQGLIQGVPDFQDFLGWSLGAADFDADGYADLAIGAPFEDSDNNTIADSGVVHIVYGAATGLVVTGNQIWHQDSFPDMLGAQQAHDRFGFALTH